MRRLFVKDVGIVFKISELANLLARFEVIYCLESEFLTQAWHLTNLAQKQGKKEACPYSGL